MVNLLKLDGLIEDLPAIVGQDDLYFGCPFFHLSKGFQGNRGSSRYPVSSDTKGFFTYTGRDKFRALSKELYVMSLLKGNLISLVHCGKKWPQKTRLIKVQINYTSLFSCSFVSLEMLFSQLCLAILMEKGRYFNGKEVRWV